MPITTFDQFHSLENGWTPQQERAHLVHVSARARELLGTLKERLAGEAPANGSLWGTLEKIEALLAGESHSAQVYKMLDEILRGGEEPLLLGEGVQTLSEELMDVLEFARAMEPAHHLPGPLGGTPSGIFCQRSLEEPQLVRDLLLAPPREEGETPEANLELNIFQLGATLDHWHPSPALEGAEEAVARRDTFRELSLLLQDWALAPGALRGRAGAAGVLDYAGSPQGTLLGPGLAPGGQAW